MIDHVGIRVTDFARSKRFFTEALAPLGYRLLREHSISGVGFGKVRPDLWIKQGTPGPRVHVALAADEREIVDAFYRAALAAGGRDDGPPGCAWNTTRIITARSSSIPTATVSKQFAASPLSPKNT